MRSRKIIKLTPKKLIRKKKNSYRVYTFLFLFVLYFVLFCILYFSHYRVFSLSFFPFLCKLFAFNKQACVGR